MGPVTLGAASMPSPSSWGTPTFSSDTQVAPALPPWLVWDLYSLESRQLCSLLLRGTNWACWPLSLLCTLRPTWSLPSTHPSWIPITVPSRFLYLHLPPRSPHATTPEADTVIRVRKALGMSRRLTPLSNHPSNSAKPRPAASSLYSIPPTS